MQRDYSVEVAIASKELTKAEKVRLKTTNDAIRLDEATKEGKVVITPDYWVTLNIHNEKANGDKDYNQYMIADKDGKMYLTGSKNFFDTFLDIFADMEGEEYSIVAFRMPSKNFKGKDFLSCALV